tara:strand:- start:72 stop:311 length:240 start_codon:yes stop_codon:yes gene_type:complete
MRRVDKIKKLRRTRRTKRTKQQLVDPWDIPKTTEVHVVEETDNITEEVELTLEELKKAYDLTTEETQKVWTKHRKNNDQ